MLKAAAGGGGKGMRIVPEEKALPQLYHMAHKEALAAFGNGDLYIEKYIPDMRHIEVQILADADGNVVHLGERDCSIQRRHQKLVEEAPFIFADAKLRRRIGELAVRAARAFRYRTAGTIEFILDSDDNIYFMEINTRIQVEHPVTEMITDIDIIKEQILLAAGEPLTLKQQDVEFRGHSMECRINAEDPERFVPSPGTVSLFIPPGGQGVRVDTAAFSGWKVPAHYDSLIAKLIVHGRDRDEAIMRMKRALGEFVIEGIKTTIPFYLKLFNHPDFLSGNFNTNFLEKNGFI
jgi:acetyl-CoA carboxylase biotin carboxylase subunit